MRLTAVNCVLFDLDGTLVDTAPDLGCAANHVRRSQGLEPLPLASYRPFASSGARGMLRIALDITPDHADFSEHRAAFLDYYGEHLSQHSQLFDGVDAVLRTLETRGVPWGVVTNKPKRYTDPLLHDLGLAVRAAVFISGDEVSSAKPAPDSLLLACQRLRLSPSGCLYVGDDKRDIDAGRAAGMHTVAASWGYEGEHPIHSWGADALIHAPDEILKLL
jgi:phosphoglycolate phosphatase